MVSCCFFLSLLLAKILFVLNDLAGRLSSCYVLGHCISWSRGTENTVNISFLQIAGCSFSVSGAIQAGGARGEDLWGVGEGRLLAARREAGAGAL